MVQALKKIAGSPRRVHDHRCEARAERAARSSTRADDETGAENDDCRGDRGHREGPVQDAEGSNNSANGTAQGAAWRTFKDSA